LFLYISKDVFIYHQEGANLDMIDTYVKALVEYGIACGLIYDTDRIYAVNRILEILACSDYQDRSDKADTDLEVILKNLLDYAVENKLIEDTIDSRDLFDTRLMGALVPWPHEVQREFRARYEKSPEEATDYYYKLSQDSDYIRRYRIRKDIMWVSASEYGDIDITINLSKPEKDPRAIAAAKLAPQGGYPSCLLCKENEGYAGRLNHPARGNHRIIPIAINNQPWFFQYSPYVYYNEHCIVFSAEHTPMKIDKTVFRKLLDFVKQFPHYFVGSNADLPIVGGSILSHDHFQGGHYTFAMAKASVEKEFSLLGFEDIKCGIVKWPMSVIRLSSKDDNRLVELSDKILGAWRGYTDEAAFVFSETDGDPHNTITPIARKNGNLYEMDLVLRNNITTKEHPMGVYHPHEELHHIKKENIGLIEVMGLAVLPARLKSEIKRLGISLINGEDVREIKTIAKHADWADELKKKYTFTADNTDLILKQEIGTVFSKVLEHAGVYARSAEGEKNFLRFIDYVNAE